jgi:hypothetical protein
MTRSNDLKQRLEKSKEKWAFYELGNWP